MKRETIMKAGSYLILFSVLVLSGCVTRTYSVTKDRVDQDLTIGNRGYLQGQSQEEPKARKMTRQTQVLEIELGFPARGKKASARPVESTSAPVYTEPEAQEPVVASSQFEEYTVQKGDTLQKISQKFYGTTKRWYKLYEANKDTLKAPDKIIPGRVIRIPVEGLKEPAENLK